MGAGRSTMLGILTTAGLAAAAIVPTAGATGAAATAPPCTAAALQAGLGRGTAPVHAAHVIRPFGCADGWAYAAVNTRRFTLSSLFRARGGRWVTVTRVRPCADGAVPRKIRTPACQSN